MRNHTVWAVLCALLVLAPASRAQTTLQVSATESRVLSDITDRLKTDDGSYATLRSTVTYDPASGEYTHLVVNQETAEEVRRLVTTVGTVPPSAAEEEAAVAIIGAHPELSALIRDADHPVTISGGFPLVREAGHGCGPGSRCLQYDVMQIVPGQRAAERIRYVVVDMRSLTMFSTDFNAATEGNLANPAARSQSRSR
jgi:hypothetical protein